MRNIYFITLLVILAWGFFSCNLPINVPSEQVEEMDIEDEYTEK